MHPALPAIAFLLCAFHFALPAQQAQPNAETNRIATTLVVASPEQPPLAAVSISYGQATWRDEYDAVLPPPAGNYMRLGVGWWTTLETIGPIEIGGVRIEAGSYYLGMMTDAEGVFSLLVFDSKKTMKARLLPATTALYRGDVKPDLKLPMVFAKNSLPAVVGKLQIELAAVDGDAKLGTLSIRWGKHRLSAAMRLLPDADKVPTAGGK